MNPRHVGNRGPPANIDIDLVGLQNFIVNHDSVGRLKAGMALDDRTIFKSSQPFSRLPGSTVRKFHPCVP